MREISLPATIALLSLLAITGLTVDGHVGRVSPDPRVEWLREHATPVHSIDPEYPDAWDLEPLVSAIDGARVVLLGEATHGSGAALLAKSRLVPFLHERMGFDVLAFESGLFSMRRAAASLLATEPRSLPRAEGLFAVWARSEQVRPVLEYVRRSYGTSVPLALDGFDIQFSGDQGEPDAYRRALERFLDRADPTLLDVADRDALTALFGPESVFGTGRTLTRERFAEQRTSIGRVLRRFRTVRERLRRVHSDRTIAFFERTLENARSLLALHETFAYPPADLDWRWTTDVRDTAMAANLAWLASDRYPDRKIIGWAANFHIARNLDSVDTMDSTFTYLRETPMGGAAHSAFGDDLYTLGFLAYDGRHGDPIPEPVESAPESSLEWLLHQVGSSYLFVDFSGLPRNHWLREPIVARPFGYLPMKANWTRVFDGIFFIDTMYPNMLMDAEVPR